MLGHSLDELNGVSRDLLLYLDQMVEKRIKALKSQTADSLPPRTETYFTRREIREFTGWAHCRVERYLAQLIDLEYVLVVCGKNGRRYRYRLAYEGQGKEGEKFLLGLQVVGELNSCDEEESSLAC